MFKYYSADLCKRDNSYENFGSFDIRSFSFIWRTYEKSSYLLRLTDGNPENWKDFGMGTIIAFRTKFDHKQSQKVCESHKTPYL